MWPLRGVTVEALKKNEEIVEPLGDNFRRVSLHDVYNPLNNEIIVKAGQHIDDDILEQLKIHL